MKPFFIPALFITVLFIGCQDNRIQREEAPMIHTHGKDHMKVLEEGDENHPLPTRSKAPKRSMEPQGHERP